MGKHQEERKTPIIVVKKRRTFSLPSLSEKKILSNLNLLNRQQHQPPPE